MIDAYAGVAVLETYCRGGAAPGEVHHVPSSSSSITAIVGRIPILRRRVDWWTLASDVQFDRHVASRLHRADIFQGAVGQAAVTLARARDLGIPTVLDVVNTHVDDFAEHVNRECRRFGARSFIHPTMRWRIRQEYERADVIRVMSNVARRTFLDRGFSPERVFVATPPTERQPSAQATHDGDTFRVGFVGMIAPWKGFHYLVEAFDQLGHRPSELVLWGGTGSRGVTRWLQQRLARNPRIILRPGEIRQAGFANVFGPMNVLVHPSLADGFAYVVAEAMACGVPAIVTSNTGASDLIVDGENGFIVPPGDSAAIAERLRILASDRARLRHMGAAARATVEISLTPDRFRSQLLGPVRALAGQLP